MTGRFQDAGGALKALGVFHNGRLVADAPDDLQRATELRNQLEVQHPGCEVLARCNTHPDRAAVDCLTCWPMEDDR